MIRMLKIRLVRSFTERLLVLFGAILAYSLDKSSKAFIIDILEPGESIPLISGLFHLTRVQNSGAAFSIMSQHPQLLIFIASLLMIAFLAYMLTRKRLLPLDILGFSLVLGGAAGNLTDRLQLGTVTDFFDLVAINYPVFNLADCFIVTGITLIMVNYVRKRDKGSSPGG